MITFGLAYLMLPFAPTMLLAAACVVLAHIGGGAQWMLSSYGLQITTPDAIRGRVMTIDFGLATLAIGVSSLIAGGSASAFSLDGTSWGLAGVAIVYAGVWLWWTRALWRSRTDPLRA